MTFSILLQRNISLFKEIQITNFNFIRSKIFDHRHEAESGKYATKSGVSHIELNKHNWNNPFHLLKTWELEALVKLRYTCTCALTTVTPEGDPSVRFMKTMGLIKQKFIFITSKKARSYKHIILNNNVSLGYYWSFKDTHDTYLNRQVIIKGFCNLGDDKFNTETYNAEPLTRKIKAALYNCNEEINWKDMKVKHDTLYTKIIHKKKPIPPKPDHVITYIVTGHEMEFYENYAYRIPDRVRYTKEGDKWVVKRIAP